MKWIDYREMLKIGICDEDKFHMLRNKIDNILEAGHFLYSDKSLFKFCQTIGIAYINKYTQLDYVKQTLYNQINILGYISVYIAFVNSLDNEDAKKYFLDCLKESLDEINIQYKVIEEDKDYFLFPKGAVELDKALVTEPLLWLKDYPLARKKYILALNQYSEGIYICDVADNLRKTLETFLQEFFENEKNLKNNITEVGKYLKNQNAEREINDILVVLGDSFEKILKDYDTLNNKIAKHNDKVEKRYLEFLLYQTGLLIRMLITSKQK